MVGDAQLRATWNRALLEVGHLELITDPLSKQYLRDILLDARLNAAHTLSKNLCSISSIPYSLPKLAIIQSHEINALLLSYAICFLTGSGGASLC